MEAADAFASVPDEVVLRTMALVDYDGERTVRGRWALSAVCKRWRDLAEDEAEGLPRLWRTVRLGAMIGRPLRHHHYQHGLVPWLRRRSRAVQTLTIAAGNYAGGGENNAFGIDAAAGGALGGALASLSSLTTLDLKFNSLNKASLDALAAGVGACPALQRLELGYNMLAESSGERLVEIIQSRGGRERTLTRLGLQHNALLDGVEQLCMALSAANFVTHLDLRANGLGADAAVGICGLLPGWSALVELLLDGNDLGADGWVAIAQAVRHCADNALRRLSIVNTGHHWGPNAEECAQLAAASGDVLRHRQQQLQDLQQAEADGNVGGVAPAGSVPRWYKPGLKASEQIRHVLDTGLF